MQEPRSHSECYGLSMRQRNHRHVDKWLYKNHHDDCGKGAMDAVASLEMVEWLHASRTEGCTAQAMEYAARKGDFESLLFLHEHYRDAVSEVIAAFWALASDYVDILQWLCCKFLDVMTATAIHERMSLEHGFRTQYSPQLFAPSDDSELS